jgi:hypothetical protein
MCGFKPQLSALSIISGSRGPDGFPLRNSSCGITWKSALCLCFSKGKLESFVREAAVVTVMLREPQCSRSPTNGAVQFRGAQAAVLQGPAEVRLAYPFVVERLPDDPGNYWRELGLAGDNLIANYVVNFVEAGRLTARMRIALAQVR